MNIRAFLTPDRRYAIYMVGILIGAVLFGLGILTPEFLNRTVEGLTAITGVILTLTNLLAAFNVPQVDTE